MILRRLMLISRGQPAGLARSTSGQPLHELRPHHSFESNFVTRRVPMSITGILKPLPRPSLARQEPPIEVDHLIATRIGPLLEGFAHQTEIGTRRACSSVRITEPVQGECDPLRWQPAVG